MEVPIFFRSFSLRLEDFEKAERREILKVSRWGVRRVLEGCCSCLKRLFAVAEEEVGVGMGEGGGQPLAVAGDGEAVFREVGRQGL